MSVIKKRDMVINIAPLCGCCVLIIMMFPSYSWFIVLVAVRDQGDSIVVPINDVRKPR